MKFTYGDVPRMFIGSLLVALFGIAFSVQYYVRFQEFNVLWIYLIATSLLEALHVPAHPSSKIFIAIRMLFFSITIIGFLCCITWSKSAFDIGATIFVAAASVVEESCLTRALSSNEI